MRYAHALALALAGVAICGDTFSCQDRDRSGVDRQAADASGIQRTRKVVGRDVKNPRGEDLGKIEEVVLDVDRGRVAYAVLSFGGFAGMGDKLFAVPWSALGASSDGRAFVLNVDQGKLKNAPGFNKTSWPAMSEPRWSEELHSYYGQESYWLTPPPGNGNGEARDDGGAERRGGNKLFHLRKSGDLLGMDVRSPKGENLGKLEDIVLNEGKGTVAYAVLSFGGFLGMGDKLFAIPWQALSGTPNANTLVLNVEKERLQNAPGFDKSNWPNFADSAVEKDIRSFYGEPVAYRSKDKDNPNVPQDKARRDADVPAGVFRVTELKGDKVVTTRGEKIGDVHDIVVDLDRGAVAYAVVELDDIPGKDGKLCAVPWTALSEPALGPDRDSLVISADKEKLKDAVCFDSSAWPNMTDGTWSKDVHKFFGQPPYWDADRSMRPTPREASGERSEKPSGELGLKRTSKLIGMDIKNRKNEDVGDVEDIVLAPRKSKVLYVVLSSGGFLGMGEKLFAIPMEALSFSTGSDTVLFDVEKERLKNAPGFDKKNWPNMADTRFSSDVNKYWEKGTTTRPRNDR